MGSYPETIDFCIRFSVFICSQGLCLVPYSDYQNLLYSAIVKMRQEEGLPFNKIAQYLNENGYKTPRGKVFEGKHVHSILKKRKLRNERLSQEQRIIINDFEVIFM